MNGRSIARAAAAVTSLGIGAVLTLSGTAAAEPSPVEAGLTQLTASAGADPAAQAGVATLDQFTKLVDISELRSIAAFTPFAYAAPTFGCGSLGPITTIIAAASTDGTTTDLNGDPIPGTLRFSAAPAHSGSPVASGLVVAWLNINTGASGMNSLDDRTEFGQPTLSKTITSGPGTVIASMWGIIDYPFAHCIMTPTVGTFFVPERAVPNPAPAPAAPAPAPAPAGTQGGPGAPQAAPAPAQPGANQAPPEAIPAPAAPNLADAAVQGDIAHRDE